MKIPSAYPADPRHGVVLVVLLGWMGFVFFLILAFCTSVRVEAAACATSLRSVEVREAARLALFMAVGQLQAAAGPDQRVTARDAETGWCGVWNTASPDEQPQWLVSGSGAGEPVLEVKRGDGRIASRVGWWTSDEGVKASLGKHSSFGHLAGWPGLPKEAEDVLKACTPLRYRCEHITGPAALPGTAEGRGGASLLGPVPPASADRLRKAPESLTWSSLGVLCDTEAGGLRRDLSRSGSALETAAASEIAAVRAALSRWPADGGAHRMAGHVDGSVVDGFPSGATPLLMHEFGLYVGIFRENVGPETRLKVHLTVRAEIWNPHSVSLQMTGRGEPDLRLVVRGLPRMEAVWTTASGTATEGKGRFSFEPGQLDARSDAEGAGLGRLGEEGFPVDIYETFTSADTRLKATRGHAALAVTIPDTSPGGDDFVTLSAGPADLEIELQTADGNLLQRFSSVPFNAFSSASVRRQELLPVYATRSPSYADYQALFHFRLLDGVHRSDPTGLSPMEQWFSTYDPRTAVIDLSKDADAGFRGLVRVNAHPDENVVLQTNFFTGDPELLNGGNFIRAFDLPLAPVVSTGWLQHLHLHGRRPFSIGNPWGGPLNRLFDGFFLSGLPPAFDESVAPADRDRFPNPHLVPVAGTGALAGRVLVEGAFNINSTSADAWRALLGSLHLGEWTFRRGYTVSGITRPHLRNGAFRFPQGARRQYKSPFLQYADYPEVTQDEKARWYKWRPGEPDWLYAFDLGLRELREEDVDALAEAVAALIRARERPFPSLADFVNSGLLQEAIDRTEVNAVADGPYAVHDPSGDAPVFPRYCPSFLTQADLLSTFAPLMSVRSDTFVIRARSEVPAGGRPSEVFRYLYEATVQRLPNLLHPDDPEKGRRFRIVSVRLFNGEGT